MGYPKITFSWTLDFERREERDWSIKMYSQ